MQLTSRALELLPKHYDRLGDFQAYFKMGVPILTYHAIARPPRQTKYRGLFYPPERFVRQLGELRDAGFQSVSMSEVRNEIHLSNRRIALTFDDGFQNLIDYALPSLEENSFRATVFLVANFLGKTNAWDTTVGVTQSPLMDEGDVRKWLAAGHRIGSHTLNHPHLTKIVPAQAHEEMRASKKKLEDCFGVQVTDFCYPYGEWNELIRDKVADAGYLNACSTEFGLNSSDTHPYSLRRITVRRPNRTIKTIRTWALRQCFRFMNKICEPRESGILGAR